MKSWSLSAVVLLLSLTATTTAILVVEFGKKCPKPPTQEAFDVTKYTGKWWEYQRFPAPFEIASTCGSANYTLLSSDTIRVVNAGIQKIKIFHWVVSRKPILAVGKAVVVNASRPAELRVDFANSFGGASADGVPNYFVVETDYDNVSVVFSCTDFFIGNIQFAWILTREQGRKPANLEDIYRTLKKSGVNLRNFITVDQKDCRL